MEMMVATNRLILIQTHNQDRRVVN